MRAHETNCAGVRRALGLRRIPGEAGDFKSRNAMDEIKKTETRTLSLRLRHVSIAMSSVIGTCDDEAEGLTGALTYE
jgi:hypothetical protein